MTLQAGRLRILVVDDEPAILRFLRVSLESRSYAVATAPNGRTALDLIRRDTTDLVVLDLNLPDMDGLDVVRQIREGCRTLPIIILSSRDDESAKVLAFDLGADDYVTKPFGIDELLARIRTALRHRLQQEGERPLFHAGDLCVDLVRRLVTVRNEEVQCSPREYEVLRLLVAHAGKVLTHPFLQIYANRCKDMMAYQYANTKNYLHGIAFKGSLAYAMRANWVELKMPMRPPDVIMPVHENVHSTLGECGEKLTGPLMFHERLGPEGEINNFVR